MTGAAKVRRHRISRPCRGMPVGRRVNLWRGVRPPGALGCWVLAPVNGRRWIDLLAADSDPFIRLLHAALDSGAVVAVQDERGHVRLLDADSLSTRRPQTNQGRSRARGAGVRS